MRAVLQKCLFGTLLLSTGSVHALIDSGALGTPGELFVAVYDAAGQRSYYQDLGINVADFLKNPVARFDLGKDPNFADFKTRGDLVFNIGAIYPLADDLSNIEAWGYLATSSGGADIFDSGFNAIDASKQVFETYVGALNPTPFTGSASDIAENLSGTFKPGDSAYFDEGSWGTGMGGITGGDTTGKQDQPLPFFHINNQTGEDVGQINRLGYWLLTGDGTLSFSAGSGNLPPVANAGADRTAGQGADVLLDGTASADPDNGPSPLTYTWTQTGGPAIVLGGANTAVARFTADQSGVYTFKLAVNDSVAGAEDSVQVTVLDASQNQAPVANAGTDQTLPVGSRVVLEASGSADPDAAPSPLTYVWSQISGPSVTLTSSSVANPDFSAQQEGAYVFQVTVSDGAASSVDAVTIQVVAAAGNQAPVADAGSDQSVVQSAPVSLDGTASADPDHQPTALAYTWRQTSGPAVIVTGRDTSTPTFTPAKTGTYTFELTVSDGAATAKDTVTITVRTLVANVPPLANAGADQTVLLGLGRKTRLDGTASADADAGPSSLTYTWTQEAGPNVVLNDSHAVAPKVTLPKAGVYVFRLTVTDGAATASDTVTVYAEKGATLKPALASAGADRTVAVGSRVQLDGSKTTGSGPVSYFWNQDSGPVHVALNGSDTVQPSATLPLPGHYVFSLTTQNAAGSSKDSVEVTVLPVRSGVTLDVPELWTVGQSQNLKWTAYQLGKQEARLYFGKNGTFRLLATLDATQQQMAWQPTTSDVTSQGVIRVCVKPDKKTPQVCDSAGIVVQP